MFIKYKNDAKKSWTLIKSILCGVKNKQNIVNMFIVDGNTISNESEIANKFNDFFSSIGSHQASKIPQVGQNSFAQYLINPPNCVFNFRQTSPDDILKIISEFLPKTSCGHDNLSMKVLKRISYCLAYPISVIVNQSFHSGIFPDLMKCAKVIPLFKKEDASIFNNYRPISLLPALSKVFEKVVHKQLYDYFNQNKLFFNNQHGFRPLHSTESATLTFVDHILKLLDNDKFPISIFMDLSKAFDTLDHFTLLHKLSFYGINNVPLNWFKSYLSDRTQYVDYNGYQSQVKHLSVGVPQGSILGPLLFLIYVNDINNVSNFFHFLLYADDTTLTSTLCYNHSILSKESVDVINFELGKVFKWLCANRLSLNIEKTKYMTFALRKRNENVNLKLSINGINLQSTDEFNFLGTIITYNLSWKSHTSYICRKLSKVIGILRRFRNMLPTKVLLSIYQSMFMPHLYYSVLVWGHSPGRIFHLQKKAIRAVFKVKYNAHTDVLFKQNKLLKLDDIYKLSALKFYHKYVNDNLPNSFVGMFDSSPIQHDYNTRERFRQQIPNKISTGKCIRYLIPKLLSDTPSCITEKIITHSIEGFGSYIKTFLSNKYKDKCDKPNCYVCGRR
jgi:hypothetical protein